MSISGTPLVNRLDEIDRRLTQFTRMLQSMESILDGMETRFETIEKSQSALDHRIKKLEREAVSTGGTLGRYMRRRIAADNSIRRWASGLTETQFEQADRLKAIELVGFPHLSADIERVIGKAGVAKSAELDRRKPPRNR